MADRLIRGSAVAFFVLALSLTFPAVSNAGGVGFEFHKIVDEHTAIPGGTGTFSGYSGAALDQGMIAFRGWEGANQAHPNQIGVYTWSGGSLSRVASTGMPIPGIPQDVFATLPDYAKTFKRFGDPSLSKGKVAFWAQNPGSYGVPATTGIYTNASGTLRNVANQWTQMPGGVDDFYVNGFSSPPSLSGGRVVFRGSNSIFSDDFSEGIYLHNGSSLSRIVDLGSGFDDLSLNGKPPVSSGGDAVFLGITNEGKQGLFLHDGTSIRTVADTDTFLPGSTEKLTSFGQYGGIATEGGDVAFIGASDHHYGIITEIGGVLATVADTTTIEPGGTSRFRAVASVSLDSGYVAFQGYSHTVASIGPHGIYTNLGGSLVKVFDSLETIDGKDVSGVSFTREGLFGDDLVFHVNFVDQTSAIYLAHAVEIEDGIEAVAAGLNQRVNVAYAAGNFFENLQVQFDEVITPGALTVEQKIVSEDAELADIGNFTFDAPGAMRMVWDISFGGAFDDGLSLSLAYDESLFAPGFDEGLLQVYHFTGGAWVAEETIAHDLVNNIITIRTSSLSPFSLGAGPAAPPGGSAVPLPSAAWAGLLVLLGLALLRMRPRF